jgi:beta-galactosidase
MRRRTSLDAGWMFFKGDVSGAADVALDDANWRRLNLPHDWSIEGPFSQDHPGRPDGAYLPAGIGWYRKRFCLTEQERGKKVFVEFDGVYKNSDVWINDQHLGFHPYGYTGFHYDLTPYLNDGDAENVLAVRVDNSTQPDARWYTGSGIYRHVWLLITDELHIAHWGTCVTTPAVSQEQAWVVIRTQVVNESAADRKLALRATIFDADGNVVGVDEGGKPSSTSRPHPLRAGAEHEVIQRIRVEKPRLWSVQDPYLYHVRSELLNGD